MQTIVVIVKILCSGVKQPSSNPPFTMIRYVISNKLLNQSAFQCPRLSNEDNTGFYCHELLWRLNELPHGIAQKGPGKLR